MSAINRALTDKRRRIRRRSSFAWIEAAIVWLIRRHLIPDLGDLALLGGVVMLGWVLYQLAPILTETYAGVLLCLIGLVKSGIVGRREP